MNRLTIVSAAALLLSSAAVYADGFYVGGSGGIGDATLRSPGLDPDLPEFDDPDDRLFVARGIGGYRINDFFAVEGTLVGYTNDEFDDGFDGDADVRFGAVTGSLVGIIPVDETFEIFARVGLFAGESEVDDRLNFFTDRNERDESGPLWGAGMNFNLGSRNQFTIRIDYEQYDTDAFDDIRSVSGGFIYNFGRRR